LLSFEYKPELKERPLLVTPIIDALGEFARAARRLVAPPKQEEATAQQRKSLAEWATYWQDRLKPIRDLRHAEDGATMLATLRQEAEGKAGPHTADMVEALLAAVSPVLDAAKVKPAIERVADLIEHRLPVLIYFENYGVLDSAIWLPRFLDDLELNPTDPRVRTINAMFKHAGLDPREIAELGNEEAQNMRRGGQQPAVETIAMDQRHKEERAIRLNSASLDISEKFSAWWSQRRHKIRYHADGDYFRIWIADDRRPDVEIELEARSKGFQWFLSFYLVFLVESDEGHKDAILLFDEPGLHLHPTAQQELIDFYEDLSERNQILYSTHSPFLIDGDRLHRVRPVTEDQRGHSRIDVETWPKDRDTMFPLQAAAGYAMARGLFQHRKNVLVESMSDYYYLHALSQQCGAAGRTTLPDDIYVTPCGGAKLVGQLASLFLGQDVRPLILLDGDDAGRVRRSALMKELYAGHASAVLMLDEVVGRPGHEVEIEDILGESVILPALNALLGTRMVLIDPDRKAGGVTNAIKAAARSCSVELPAGWKASIAISLVSKWAESGTMLSQDILNRAEALFKAINESFSEDVSTSVRVPANTPLRL
jgi:hypothetical protein